MVASKWIEQGWRPKCPTHPNPGYGTCSENHTGRNVGCESMYPNGLGNTNLGHIIKGEKGYRLLMSCFCELPLCCIVQFDVTRYFSFDDFFVDLSSGHFCGCRAL